MQALTSACVSGKIWTTGTIPVNRKRSLGFATSRAYQNKMTRPRRPLDHEKIVKLFVRKAYYWMFPFGSGTVSTYIYLGTVP